MIEFKYSRYKVLFGLACCLVLTICSACRHSISMGEFRHYMLNPDNGLIKEVSAGDFSIAAQYLPPAYQLMQDIKQVPSYSPEALDSLKESYSAYYYFRIMIKSPGLLKNEANADYFNYTIEHDFKLLVDKGDSLNTAFCQRIMNGNSAYGEYMLAFPKVNNALSNHDHIALIYKGEHIGAKNERLSFSVKKLTEVPSLKDIK